MKAATVLMNGRCLKAAALWRTATGLALAGLLPALAQPLETRFRALLAQDAGPGWIAYTVPAVAGAHLCGEAATADLQVMYRVDSGAVSRIRTTSEGCKFDLQGLPVRRLPGVSAAESVALVESMADRDGDGAISAIALHAGPDADRALQRFAAPGRPEKMRERAVFWMGASRGVPGSEFLRRVVRGDASENIREKAVFALFVSKEPGAADAIVESAHGDPSPRVRRQAIFWLAQKAGAKALGEIDNAIANDPDTEVRKHAVFAVAQMKDQGVPKLIEVARTNRNREVRRQAMFWLGQSNDPRALAFFEEILKR